MNFGIAYLPDSGEIPTPPGTILGTPAYLASELAQGGQMGVLPASDQYSLGAVLYETLRGQPPFLAWSAAILRTSVLCPLPCLDREPEQVEDSMGLVSERPGDGHEQAGRFTGN